MRLAPLCVGAALALLVPTAASAGDARTTRIETRPFYGATVTLEEGVRVFRPLPRHERVIINPGGRTPLNLTYEEHRSYNYSRETGHGAPERAERDYAAPAGAVLGDVPVAGTPGPVATKGHVPIGRARGPAAAPRHGHGPSKH